MGVLGVIGSADSIEAGIALALESMRTGKALETLDKWAATTQALEAEQEAQEAKRHKGGEEKA